MTLEVKPNWLDKAVSFFNPRAGLRRYRARAMVSIVGAMGGYVGARLGRPATKQWLTSANDADTDILSDLPKLRARSRDLARNAPIAIGAIGTTVQSVVGTGLSLQSRPDAKVLGMSDEQADEWAAQVETEFRLWSESRECDLTRTQTFFQMQSLVFRSGLESGDVFVLFPMQKSRFNPYSLRLQVLEADRVDTPLKTREGVRQKDETMVSGGVRLDKNGAPSAYHILADHPGRFKGRSHKKGTWVPAFGAKTGRRNMLHVFERTRPGQTRGVPYLAPVIEPIKQLDKYTEAEVMAAVVSSLLTVFVKTDSEGLLSQPETPTAAEKEQEVKLSAGTIVDLGPGEDIATVSPNRPNTAFDDFMQAVLRQIGIALGLPFEVLVKHFTASFSASRAALLEAWRFFRTRREFLAAEFCQPVYETWLEEAVARGRIAAPGFFTDPRIRLAFIQAEWVGDAPGQIDPVKEVQAAERRLAIGVSTLAEETTALTGGIWEDKHRQQVKERKMRERDGLTGAMPAQAPAEDPEEKPEDGQGSDLEKEEEN